MFGASEPLRTEKIHENILPSTILASIVLTAVAAPFVPTELGPLAIAQARKPQLLEDTISESPPVQKHTRSRTVHVSAGKSKRSKSARARSGSGESNHSPSTADGVSKKRRPSLKRDRSTITMRQTFSEPRQASPPKINGADSRPGSSSIPDYPYMPGGHKAFEAPTRPGPFSRSVKKDDRRRSQHETQPVVSPSFPTAQKTSMLRAHYFRCETQFLSALEGISNRLVSIPKPARLSALRAELALIARDLPAEVDVPSICPATLVDGIPSHSKHHRIVRLNPAEATSLNSAERVPYLLMVEVLRDDFDFHPDSPANQRLLSTLITEKEQDKRRLFDISAAARPTNIEIPRPAGTDSVFEPATGDLSSPDLLKDMDNERPNRHELALKKSMQSIDTRKTPPKYPSSSNIPILNPELPTPHNPEPPPINTAHQIPRRDTSSPKERLSSPAEQTDISAVATHIRTAAQMLAQLDVSGSKRPRQEVENIKTKIIASMQNLEDQNFSDESPATATFDNIMAQVHSEVPIESADDADVSTPETGVNSGAGAARMENDQKIGGVRRKGDRDDPSAATFGEDWKSKKERIRRSSPYGWMKTWDLLSVIVKTGSDLRQELFACQLIRICMKIWEDAKVPVWVKDMRILVTGESSGLIETITNGVSLHSLKRSLTLSSIAAGTNPRKRFATLKDHFVKTFGEVDSAPYKAGEEAFMRSLAAYSILSYVLQLKDRHNGNILIDNQGHIIHIDFGFMLSNSPGSVGFEAAPFKLTSDYVDVLGGAGSPAFDGFKGLCKQAFLALRKSAESIVMLVEMMSKESKMACFTSGAAQTTASLRQRFMLHLSQEEAETFVENDLISKSIGSYYTRLYVYLVYLIISTTLKLLLTVINRYDTFQYRTQGIY